MKNLMPNVVVIDDDRSVCEMIRRSLERIDLVVSTVSRADDGLNSIRKESPDVVLLDIMLPGTSGLDVFQKIRDIDRTADLSNAASRMTLNSPPDYGPPTASENPKPPAIFAGSFGADRNGNDVLDRGPVPRSVRMRGITVARYNFYDTRLPGQMK